jgi:cell division protein FtsI/penicillin-binding protein 2
MSLKSRACIACYGLGALFTALSARLIHIAVVQHEEYAAIARNNHIKKMDLIALRGSILDAKGAFLARNEPLRNVILDGSLIKDPRAAAELLAGPLKMRAEDILKHINPTRRYVVLKKKIAEELAGTIDKAVQKARMKGITFEQDFERVYPAHDMLCHVVGFFGFEEGNAKTHAGTFRGIEGVERSMDTWLAGQNGWRYIEKDGRGRELVNHAGEERAPRNGANVRLTVDLNLQQIVESELALACKRLRPIKASAVMMNPETGEILALANRPSFDPNEPGKAKPENRFNNAVAGIIEPGSTFKAITSAGAINSHLVTPNTEIWCENGKWMFGGKILHDHHPYGMLTVSQIIEKSSNIGAAKLAVQLGEERFYNYIRGFGFGQQTGIALPGEVRGILHPRHTWSNISISRIAIGHEVGATPLQVTTATCAIANGGRLMTPKLIHDIRDDQGNVLAAYQPQEVRRIITESTAAKVRDALIKVTGPKGTASRAHIPGFNVAGKTGTAQKIEDGHYSHEHHVTSFIGFVPAEKPAFCLMVIFDEAQVKASEDVGGLVAAPVFRSIAEKALAYLGVQPDPVLLQREKEQEIILAKAGRN